MDLKMKRPSKTVRPSAGAGIPVAIAAERASVSKTTWLKVEKGDPGVLAGTYATVLFILGLVDRLAALADPASDNVGLRLEEEQLPQRIRQRKRKSTGEE